MPDAASGWESPMTRHAMPMSWRGRALATTPFPMIIKWCIGVIAPIAWQAWRFSAGSKIGKGLGCGPEVGKSGVMGVASGGRFSAWVSRV